MFYGIPFKNYQVNRFFFISLWVLTALGSYWMGLKNHPIPSVLPHSVSLEKKEQMSAGGERGGDLNKKDSSNLPLHHKGGDKIHSLVESRNFPQIQDEVKNLSNRTVRLRSSHPIERLEAFAELIQQPIQENIDLAKQIYHSLPGGAYRLSELRMLAYALGEIDPRSAIEWSNKQAGWEKHVASIAVMNSWARNDADAAVNWAKENHEGQDNPYLVGIIQGLAETDFSKATALMMELPYGRNRGRSASVLFEKAWSQGEDVAANWVASLPEGSVQNYAYAQLAEKVAKSDLTRAVGWVESMPESDIKVSVMESIIKERALTDTPETARWVSNLPDGKSKTKGMLQVAEFWTRRDPVATADWINQLPPDPGNDPIIETFVKGIHKSDPEGALSWAETITDKERRKNLVSLVERQIKADQFPSK